MDFAVITVSDRCFEGTTADLSGEKLEAVIKTDFPASKILRNLVPDDKIRIKQALISANTQGCSVIFTTGGTGFSSRDVTPEATRDIMEREAAGLSYAMISGSLRVTPMAMLSRAVCGIFGKSVIINLPGSPKAAVECYGFVRPALEHAVDLLKGNLNNVEKQHGKVQEMKSKVVLPRAASRVRESPYPMIEVKDAVSMIKDEFSLPEESCVIDISECLHKTLAEDVFSEGPLPPFQASTKDGYAVLTCDGAGVRKVCEVVAAGDKPSLSKLQPGQIARINTGAPIPPGADAVVQVEDTEVVEASEIGDELLVRIKVAPKLSQDIRPIGCDIPANTKILSKGQRITPAVVGVLASIGRTAIKVVRTRKCSIGIISTGNELQNPRVSLKPGQIHDSNKLALIALLKQHNYTADDCGLAKDNPDDVFRVLTSALSKHNIVITTGGVSMGEYDVVKKVLVKDFGARICFGRVNMKPGKPTTFAVFEYHGSKKFVFGLPGNPVSAMVTTILFVLPALRLCSGLPNPENIVVELEEDIALDPRPEYMRAWVYKGNDGRHIARKRGDQISSRLNSLVGANVLLLLPSSTEDIKQIPKGCKIAAIAIDQIG